MDLTGKSSVVIGLGVSGMEAARLMAEHGASVTVRDNGDSERLQSRAEELRAQGVAVELGEAVGASTAFDIAVLSPGIDPARPVVARLIEAGVPVIGELELAYQYCLCPVIAVTGTNGKTTTTELIETALAADGRKVRSCGNIGTAFSAAVRDSKELDMIVLEVSSFQLEQIDQFRPDVAVYLNLSPDHLDRYASMEEYRAAKWNIFRNQEPEDFAVVNAAAELPPYLVAQKTTFSSSGAAADYQLIDGKLCCAGEPILDQSATQLRGPHNAENMLAALAVADTLGADRAKVCAALSQYRPQRHRCENVGLVNGVIYLNDSKATNIDALEKALLGQIAPVVLIAGGKDKGLDMSTLGSLVGSKTKRVLLLGEMADKLELAWGEAAACERVATMDDAVRRSAEIAESGDVVLLSPGCSSYDMYTSYEARGDHFRDLVAKLSEALR